MIKERVVDFRSGSWGRGGNGSAINKYSVLMFGVCTEEKDSVTISDVQFTIKSTIRFIILNLFVIYVLYINTLYRNMYTLVYRFQSHKLLNI